LSKVNWVELLGWSEEEINDLRFVGYSYIKQGHYQTALKFFEALVVLDPKCAYDLQTTGALYLQLGDNLTALNYFDRALIVETNHGPTLLNRAKALFLLGYQQQGITEATSLKQHTDIRIASQAEALLLAYT